MTTCYAFFSLLYALKLLFWLCFDLSDLVYIAKSYGPAKGKFCNVLSLTNFEDPTTGLGLGLVNICFHKRKVATQVVNLYLSISPTSFFFQSCFSPTCRAVLVGFCEILLSVGAANGLRLYCCVSWRSRLGATLQKLTVAHIFCWKSLCVNQSHSVLYVKYKTQTQSLVPPSLSKFLVFWLPPH